MMEDSSLSPTAIEVENTQKVANDPNVSIEVVAVEQETNGLTDVDTEVNDTQQDNEAKEGDLENMRQNFLESMTTDLEPHSK
uniref:Uncharacterized protein n=1 Tax=Cannabis sativa TaxID=3483 RepID=A0A803PVY2_CANSA